MDAKWFPLEGKLFLQAEKTLSSGKVLKKNSAFTRKKGMVSMATK